MTKLDSWKRAYVVLVLCLATAIASPAQTFTTLYSFCPETGCPDGSSPYGGVVQGTDGNFYGTTEVGGMNGDGTVFKITPAGTLTTLHSFDGTDEGINPLAGLALGTDGNFYGTTEYGPEGMQNFAYGTVFKISPAGTLTTLHSFKGSDGQFPSGGLGLGTDGNFYGTTLLGGTYGDGTAFKITRGGKLTTLHSFDETDGFDPTDNDGLVQGTDGNFYGTTEYGPAGGLYGTVFKITPAGVLKTLHVFCSEAGCADGELPHAGLVQGTDGNLYGTTRYGGANGDGTVFKITTEGTLTTLHSFDGTDGSNTVGGLVQGTDGNFYGTTEAGGVNGDGTVFRITTEGTLTTLHSFDGTDGANPVVGLLQGTDGSFYGTTVNGGANGDGTVFSLSVGLGPFVEMIPTSGKVGAKVTILGTSLAGATAVSFNGIAATSFKVVSASEITTTVPAGATTGTLTVTTPGGMLSSNVAFRVTAQIKSFTPTSGPVGSVVTITGVSLTQASEVSFDGVAASFTVNSDTQVTATVPTGANTGKIAITTAGGMVTSRASFKVTT